MMFLLQTAQHKMAALTLVTEFSWPTNTNFNKPDEKLNKETNSVYIFFTLFWLLEPVMSARFGSPLAVWVFVVAVEYVSCSDSYNCPGCLDAKIQVMYLLKELSYLLSPALFHSLGSSLSAFLYQHLVKMYKYHWLVKLEAQGSYRSFTSKFSNLKTTYADQVTAQLHKQPEHLKHGINS